MNEALNIGFEDYTSYNGACWIEQSFNVISFVIVSVLGHLQLAPNPKNAVKTEIFKCDRSSESISTFLRYDLLSAQLKIFDNIFVYLFFSWVLNRQQWNINGSDNNELISHLKFISIKPIPMRKTITKRNTTQKHLYSLLRCHVITFKILIIDIR